MSRPLFAENTEEIEYALRLSLPHVQATPVLWCELGRIQHELNQHKNAIESYKRALDMKAEYLPALVGLGKVYYGNDRYATAKKYLLKAVKVGECEVTVWNMLANSATELKDYKQASKAFAQSLKIDAEQTEVWNSYGNVLSDGLDEYERALACFDEVIKRDQTAYWAIYNKGLAYKRMKEYNKAIDAYKQSLAVRPNYRDAIDGIGVVYLNMRNFDEAKKYFQQNIDNAHWYSSSVYNMACLYAVFGKKKKALEYLNRALQIDRKDYIDWVTQDEDFKDFWEDQDFLAVLARFKA